MTRRGWSPTTRQLIGGGWLALVLGLGLAPAPWCCHRSHAQPTPPPLRDGFQTDADGDGIPDGWFNIRDWQLRRDDPGAPGSGPGVLRFEADQPGRPSRAHRGLEIPWRHVGAIEVAVWVRTQTIGPGEREGQRPGLVIDLLGDDLVATGVFVLEADGDPDSDATSRGNSDGEWVKLAQVFPIPVGTNEAILALGLHGATGQIDFDGLTIVFQPRQPLISSSNLVRNPGFEWGCGSWVHGWSLEQGARRVHPGWRSDSALELSSSRSRASCGLAITLDQVRSVEIRFMAKATGLRARGGVVIRLFSLDRAGGIVGESLLAQLTGSFDWKPVVKLVSLPAGTHRAVLQIDKLDSFGSIRLDDFQILTQPDPSAGTWSVETPSVDADALTADTWPVYQPVDRIVPGSPLDASRWPLNRPDSDPAEAVPAASATLRPLKVVAGRLVEGGEADESTLPRPLFGLSLIGPTMLPEDAEQADRWADRLAASGVDLVRVSDPDGAFGPGSSLIDPFRDDTRVLDPESSDRFTRFLDALASRGLRWTLDLQSRRRFRVGDAQGRGEDAVALRDLPPGGGPAVGFDPIVGELAREFAAGLFRLSRSANSVTLANDPGLAWVALAGDHSAFDLERYRDDPRFRNRAARGSAFWKRWESAAWSEWVRVLRSQVGLRSPLAGASHPQRSTDFLDAQTIDGLEVVDDRLLLGDPRFSAPERRGLAWDGESRLIAPTRSKRLKAEERGRAYVLGHWARGGWGAWANDADSLDLMAVTAVGASEGWSAVIRRGLFRHPDPWGASAPGTGGGSDLVRLSGVVNAHPGLFGLLPHASALFRHREGSVTHTLGREPGWFVFEGPTTVGVASQVPGRLATVGPFSVRLDPRSPAQTIAVTAWDGRGLSESRRLLVTAVGRVRPTGFRWADCWKTEVADPGRPPLRIEPLTIGLIWRSPTATRGQVRVSPLDEAGRPRAGSKPPQVVTDPNRGEVAWTLTNDQAIATLHWEVVVE